MNLYKGLLLLQGFRIQPEYGPDVEVTAPAARPAPTDPLDAAPARATVAPARAAASGPAVPGG